ncbi:hypothetical protein B9057_07760 [Aestuarium zhoushanense]|nr:hypothetical protein B9057_07760 [Aestuarium zhoushanense]
MIELPLLVFFYLPLIVHPAATVFQLAFARMGTALGMTKRAARLAATALHRELRLFKSQQNRMTKADPNLKSAVGLIPCRARTGLLRSTDESPKAS